MSSPVTPSGKAHERVKGRWVRDIAIESHREWMVYYAKQVIGTPIPWLFAAFACLIFLSRAGVEVAAWGCALLTALYITADRFSKTREFSFFRIGSDFFLLGYVIVALISAGTSNSFFSGLATLGHARWVILLYLFTYCWELFPGLNRLFALLLSAASIATVYGFWQHFMGIDLYRGETLPYAPAQEHAYFSVIGFFNSPEIFGTMLATLLPFPAAAFLLEDEKNMFGRVMALGLMLLLALGVFWTYRPGLWMAAGAGIFITMLMIVRQGRGLLTLLGTLVGFFAIVVLVGYNSPDQMLAGVHQAEFARSEQQRAQINAQVSLWQQNTWVGVGHQATAIPGYDPNTGNIYFQVLAQTGVLGLAFYLLFILSFLLSTYRIFQEIPRTHYWHRVLISGGLASQIAFHMAGLYWSTLAEAFAVNLFVFLLSAIAYLSEHYGRGLVPDDLSL